jgi:hypothetical protein
MSTHTVMPLAVIAWCLLPCGGTSQLIDPDTLSAEQVVTAARRATYGLDLGPTVERAARGCRTAESSSWERLVVRGILEAPLQSYFGPDSENWRNNASARVAAAMSYGLSCRDVDVAEWLRAGLGADLDAEAYIPLVEGLVRALGASLVDDVIGDAGVDPDNRVWATEALIGAPATDSREVVLPAPVPLRQLVSTFAAHGLPDGYVEKWLPLLLTSRYTREGVAQDLARLIEQRPERLGTASILRILGPNVMAYDYRFSEETRTMVQDLLAGLGDRRISVAPDVLAAVRAAEALRADGRNHEGVRVRVRDLDLDAVGVGSECILTAPAAVLDAVELVAPGYQVAVIDDVCSRDAIQYGDFDGDGGRDAVIDLLVGQDPVTVAVVSGDATRAYVLPDMRPDWETSVRPPGTFKANWCESPEVFAFPNDYIMGSAFYSSGVYRFNGSAFELVATSAVCS